MRDEIFKKTLFGYNRDDVSNFIENLISDNRRIIKVKEENIQNLQRKVNELELQVNRLNDIESKFLTIQEKFQQTSELLEEKNQSSEILNIKVDELQEQLNRAKAKEPDLSLEEELKKEVIRLREELALRKKETEKLFFEYEKLKEKDLILKEKENMLEKEKALIGNAILRAQEKAIEMDNEISTQYVIEKDKIKNYKGEIETLRLKTIEVLQLFETELDSISETSDCLYEKGNDLDEKLSLNDMGETGRSPIQLIKCSS